jgi:hypothetical protein
VELLSSADLVCEERELAELLRECPCQSEGKDEWARGGVCPRDDRPLLLLHTQLT